MTSRSHAAAPERQRRVRELPAEPARMPGSPTPACVAGLPLHPLPREGETWVQAAEVPTPSTAESAPHRPVQSQQSSGFQAFRVQKKVICRKERNRVPGVLPSPTYSTTTECQVQGSQKSHRDGTLRAGRRDSGVHTFTHAHTHSTQGSSPGTHRRAAVHPRPGRQRWTPSRFNTRPMLNIRNFSYQKRRKCFKPRSS